MWSVHLLRLLCLHALALSFLLPLSFAHGIHLTSLLLSLLFLYDVIKISRAPRDPLISSFWPNTTTIMYLILHIYVFLIAPLPLCKMIDLQLHPDFVFLFFSLLWTVEDHHRHHHLNMAAHDHHEEVDMKWKGVISKRVTFASD